MSRQGNKVESIKLKFQASKALQLKLLFDCGLRRTGLAIMSAPSQFQKIDGLNGGKRIPSLDGLRAIAILMVLIGHGFYSQPEFTKPFLRIFSNGGLGVLIFFVLSGFLIHHLTVREVDKTGGFSWKGFYRRRILRIFPAFYTYIIILCILVYFGFLEVPWKIIIAAASYSFNYEQLFGAFTLPAKDYHVIGHYWTLALEEQFYLTWPLMVLLMRKRCLFGVLTGFILMAPLIRVASYFLMPDSRGQIGMMFHTGFDSIAVGVLLGEALRKPSLSHLVLKWALNKYIVIIATVFLLFVSPYLTSRFEGGYTLTVGKTLQLLAICLVIIYAIAARDTFLFKFLNWPPLVFIGVLSYSLYIWNNIFLYDGGGRRG